MMYARLISTSYQTVQIATIMATNITSTGVVAACSQQRTLCLHGYHRDLWANVLFLFLKCFLDVHYFHNFNFFHIVCAFVRNIPFSVIVFLVGSDGRGTRSLLSPLYCLAHVVYLYVMPRHGKAGKNI